MTLRAPLAMPIARRPALMSHEMPAVHACDDARRLLSRRPHHASPR